MIRILLSVFIITCLFSCKKSKLNPYCWGEAEKGFIIRNYGGCNFSYVLYTHEEIDINNNPITHLDLLQITNNIPKELSNTNQDTIPVRYRGRIDENSADCVDCCLDLIKIRCIQKR